MKKTKLILGTMTFGPQVDAESSRIMVQCFVDAGYRELDTAYVYNNGETEKILGSILMDLSEKKLVLGTKVNPKITGRLDADAVKMQFNESLSRMGQDSADILYLHFPDPTTPIGDALEACANLHGQGKFTELGLSNFPAWSVVDIWHLCKERGWPKPSVYQGMYNGLSRNVESELFPALRQLGMRFYAYNPLAGGLLSGKYLDFKDDPSAGRFTLRPNYRDRYWKESFFSALSILAEICCEVDIPLSEAALRWLAFHSCLDQKEGDGIIIGASKIDHLDQNLVSMEKGALPTAVVEAFGTAWEQARPDCPDYFRYST